METAVGEDLEKAPIVGERTGVQVNSKCNDPHRLRLAALKKQKGGQGGWRHKEGVVVGPTGV